MQIAILKPNGEWFTIPLEHRLEAERLLAEPIRHLEFIKPVTLAGLA